jgi:aryl-alcohol dehydrogenase-like predicted oxidoreductase
MGLVVWSPLASGVLTGKYDDGIPAGARLERLEWLRDTFLTDVNRQRVRRFAALAERAGVSRATLAVAWTLRQTAISSVILGATTMAQLNENLAALDVSLDDTLAAEIDALFAVAG